MAFEQQMLLLSSGGWEVQNQGVSMIRFLAKLLLGLQMAALSLGPHGPTLSWDPHLHGLI